MTIVGLPDTAVQESRDRVQNAVKNAGLHFPRHRVVVNLAPATVRKEGPSYDLPIALGVIVLAGFLPHEKVENTMVIGELSLDGVVRHARGVAIVRYVLKSMDTIKEGLDKAAKLKAEITKRFGAGI